MIYYNDPNQFNFKNSNLTNKQIPQRQIQKKMMNSRLNRHKCQIDCTNHDEVINNLQLKSKDLYYFWRNYEWLYNRYYSEMNTQKQPQVVKVKENHDQCNHRIDQLEDQIEKWKKDCKKLKFQNQSLKNQLQNAGSSHVQTDYRKQITLLKSRCAEYEGIRDKMHSDLSKLKATIRDKDEELEEERRRWQKQQKRHGELVVQLERTIDTLRNTKSSSPQVNMEEYSRRQSTIITTRLKDLNLESQRIVAQEMQIARKQISQTVKQMIMGLSSAELSQVIVNYEQA